MDTKIFEISGKPIWVARDKSVAEVAIWGSGKPRRELMFVDDAADAIVFVLERYSASDPINIGISIRELAELTAKVVGSRGAFTFDASKPGGAPRRLLDNSPLATLGWRASTDLADGLGQMYQWCCNNKVHAAAQWKSVRIIPRPASTERCI